MSESKQSKCSRDAVLRGLEEAIAHLKGELHLEPEPVTDPVAAHIGAQSLLKRLKGTAFPRGIKRRGLA